MGVGMVGGGVEEKVEWCMVVNVLFCFVLF